MAKSLPQTRRLYPMHEYLYPYCFLPQDQRVREIYLRFHEKRTMILDDLRYLYLKDPESCEKFIQSIIEPEKSPIRREEETEAVSRIANLEDGLDRIKDQLKRINHSDSTIKQLSHMKESMQTLKQEVSDLNSSQLSELMNHLYKATEMRKQVLGELDGWQRYLTNTVQYSIGPLHNLLAEMDGFLR